MALRLVFSLAVALVVPYYTSALRLNIDRMDVKQPEKVRIVQYGDSKYIAKYQKWINTIDKFCKQNGWKHSMVEIDPATLPYNANADSNDHHKSLMVKPTIILSEMAKMDGESWMIFLDLDIAIANQTKMLDEFGAPSPKQFQKTLHSEKSFQGKLEEKVRMSNSLNDVLRLLKDDCDFVAQDAKIGVNSGFVALRGPFDESSNARKFVQSWQAECDRIRPWGQWNMDQGPFQHALLKEAVKQNPQFSYGKEWQCDQQVHFNPNEQWANLHYNMAIAKLWNEKMAMLGLRKDKRSFGKYCLLSQEERFNMHDAATKFKMGDVFYHGKDEKKLPA